MDEAELIARAKAGDREALGGVLMGYRKSCYSFALRMSVRAEDAEDACQEAFLRVLRDLASFDPARGSFRSWLFGMVAHTHSNRLSSERARRKRERSQDVNEREDTPAPTGLEREELRRRLDDALRQLEEACRLPIVLHYEQGFTYAEIAAALAMPEGTVATNIRRGLEELKRLLVKAGYGAVALGAVEGMLSHAPAVSVPAGLTALVEKIGSGAAAAGMSVAEERGGLAMKLMLGVLAAGVLAGSAALVDYAVAPAETPPPPSAGAATDVLGGAPAPGGALKIEHLAFASAGYYYLDGPRLEAAAPLGRPTPGAMDDDENVWVGRGGFGGVTGQVHGRCLLKESGVIRTIFGDDYWTGFPDLDEGPDATIATDALAAGLGQPSNTWFVYGAPFQGEAKGFLLFSDGVYVRKVFRNAEKGNRWWFRRIIGGGKEALPRAKGGTVKAREIKNRVQMVQVMPDGMIVIYATGGFYEYKEGKLTCLLGPEDYKDSSPKDSRTGKPATDLTMGVMGGDGTFYFGNYFGAGYSGQSPCIWRIVPGGKMEPYAWAPVPPPPTFDGPAMNSEAHCGFHFWAGMHNYKYIPGDIIFPISHDEVALRRLRNGRISSVMPGGEWVEAPKRPKISWFKRCQPGPRGMLTTEYEEGSKCIIYLVSGVDYSKETSGPSISTAPLPWPPNGSAEKKEAK